MGDDAYDHGSFVGKGGAGSSDRGQDGRRSQRHRRGDDDADAFDAPRSDDDYDRAPPSQLLDTPAGKRSNMSWADVDDEQEERQYSKEKKEREDNQGAGARGNSNSRG